MSSQKGKGRKFGFYGGPNMRFISHPVSAHGYMQKVCHLCTGKALYHCGGKGFCKVHREEAVKLLTKKRDRHEEKSELLKSYIPYRYQ